MNSRTITTLATALALLAMTAVSPAQSDATLSNLAPSAGSLTPAFVSGTLTYTATVPNAVASITVTPTATDALATIKIAVNGGSPVAIASGTSSDPVSLSIGDTVITTVIVSQDTTATNTYTLTVTRPPPSSNANLTGLVPTPGALIPAFAAGTLNYKANVAYGSTIMNDPTITMTVRPTAADATATITVNGAPVVSGSSSDPISLGLGANIITTEVTAQDGVTTKTYTLTVTRAGVVGNPGFEVRGAVNPLPDGYDEFHAYGTEIWRQWQRTGNGGPCRIWNPGTPGCGRQTTGSIDEGFGGNAADGDYIMVVRSSSSDGANFTVTGGTTNYFEALTQLLPVTFDPAMTYTLTVKVGRPPGSSTYTANWFGYAVQLAVGGTNQTNAGAFAGSVTGGTLIAEDINTLTVPVDGWVTAKVRYTPDPANAGLAGQFLQIRLCCLEDPLNLAASGIVAFDDIRLEGDVIPEGDVTPPTLTGTGIVDDKSGAPVPANTMVTYTVNFSETMDASTVIAAGFTNAGTATIVPGSITHLSGTVFTVQVTPSSTGTLELQVPAGAIMKDISGNALDTGAAIADDATLTVGDEVVSDGTWILNNADYWNNPVDWSGGIVANGTDKTAFFTADINPQTTIFANTPRTIGNITFTDPTSSHDLQLSGSSILTLDTSSGTPVIDVTQSNRILTFAGPLRGTDGLTKNGAGTLRARVTGTYTGDTTVSAGVLEIGMGTGTYAGNIAVASGATLRYAVDDRKWQSKISLDGVISGEGALLKGGRTGLTLTNDNTYTGVTTVTGGVLLLNSANALPGGIGTIGGTSALTLNGGVVGLGVGDFTRSLAAAGTTTGVNFTGNGGWAAYGADRLVNLGGASDPIVWAATDGSGLNAKTLIFGNVRSTTFTTSPAVLPSTHKVTLQNPLDLGAAVRTVQADDGTAEVDGELSGVLSGTGGLTKAGAGTLVLSADNTYTGVTTVSAGTLLVNGNQSAATGAVAVTAGTLGGTGTLGGSVTVAAASSLAPGASAGTLSILGDLTISAPANGGAGKLRFELATPAASDRIAGTGTLTIGTDVLGFSDFVFTNLGGLQAGTYKLITSSGITGSLDPTPANLTGTIGTFTGTLQITGSDLELEVTGGGGLAGYALWAATNAPTGSAKDDYDGDGVTNGVEYVLGGTKDTNDLAKLPKASTTPGGDVLFTCVRDQASIDGTTAVVIEVGTTLAAWPDSYPVPGTAVANNPGVTVVKDSPGAGKDTVTLTLPRAPDAKKFARLKVVVAP